MLFLIFVATEVIQTLTRKKQMYAPKCVNLALESWNFKRCSMYLEIELNSNLENLDFRFFYSIACARCHLENLSDFSVSLTKNKGNTAESIAIVEKVKYLI